MPTTRAALSSPLLLLCAGTLSLALPIASVALFAWAKSPTHAPAQDAHVGEVAPSPPRHLPAAAQAGNRRFTLRLGQGFRFRDGAVVRAMPDEQPDVTFKYVPPQVGGLSTRYNPISQQVETGLEPTLTAPMPLLLATHVQSFEARPDVARITSGDIAEYQNQTPVASGTRYVLLMNQTGDQFLLRVDELEAVPGRYDDWRIGCSYEPVRLPLGLAGGRINQPLPGKLVFRDWYRTKMIVSVDLTTGREDVVADGILPSLTRDGLLGHGDSSSAYVIRDAGGRVLHTIRFNEQVLGPVLSPDGTRLVGSVYRTGPGRQILDVNVPGPAVLSVGVFDLAGREICSVLGYDDATWTPDGKLIATGSLYEPGLFEIDPATRSVSPIAADLGCPLQPSVSPDGTTIAFVTGERIWLIDRDGKHLRQLFADGKAQQRPVFSPDGTKIAAIVCNHLGNDATGDVFVIDLRSGRIVPLRTNMGAALVPDTTTRLHWVP